MKVIILCGGKGVRTFPYSEYLPKPMMPVAGTPMEPSASTNWRSVVTELFVTKSTRRPPARIDSIASTAPGMAPRPNQTTPSRSHGTVSIRASAASDDEGGRC